MSGAIYRPLNRDKSREDGILDTCQLLGQLKRQTNFLVRRIENAGTSHA
jgi:hypothetical protein